jgi:hypothetical protein
MERIPRCVRRNRAVDTRSVSLAAGLLSKGFLLNCNDEKKSY